MTIKSLNYYGSRRKVFQGKGIASFTNGSEVQASFSLVQLTDVNLLVSIDVKQKMWNFLANSFELDGLRGTLQDGRPINAYGFFIKESKQTTQSKTSLVGYTSGWEIGEKNFQQASFICFDIVNFRFDGTETEVFIEGKTQRTTSSSMRLSLGKREFTLRWTKNYDQAVATLRAQQGVQVTCTVSTKIEDSTELEAVITDVETLCDVMTVARGTLVNWVSFEVKSKKSDILFSRYRNSITRRFSGIELISSSDRQSSKSFLERGFSRCQEIAPDFQIRKIARAFTETRAGAFIESRSLLIGVLIEYIASVRARIDNRTYFLNQEVFEKRWESFKPNVLIALESTYPEIVSKHLGAIMNNIRGLNRRPFSWKINNLSKWLNIEFEKGEVEKFVKVRNSLAHEGRFPESETPAKHYQRMQHFIDRVMLRLFDYHGSYYDIEHSEIRKL